MLTVNLEFTPWSLTQDVTGLSLGHITVTRGKDIITSQGQMPDQAMMLYPSMIDLLDRIRCLLENSTKKETFTGTDCSFQITIEQTADRTIMLKSGITTIKDIPQDELVTAIWHDLQALFKRHPLPEGDMLESDLFDAMEEFAHAFCLAPGGREGEERWAGSWKGDHL